MKTTVADFLLERLHQWNIKRLFGYPGDGINGLITIARDRRRWSDSHVPPLPPHITRTRAGKYYAAIEKGDPDAAAVEQALAKHAATD